MPCACEDHCATAALEARQRVTLRVVLVINAVMFLVIAAAALYADSTALLADSLDNLGDALTYALSLYAVSRGPTIKARVALFKGGLILLASAGVAAQIVHRSLAPGLPCSRSWVPSACWAWRPMACVSGCSPGTASMT